MKESRHNSGTSLFLMEMILALLFLSLSSAACIQIFAAARKNRLQAEQWNQIQALTTSVGEILEGTDGTDEQFLSLLPGGIKKNTNLIWYYDRNWQSCSSGEAACEMILETDISSSEKSGELSFRQLSNCNELYRITLRFPVDDKGGCTLKQKHTSFVTVGIPSLFLIFSVLCLCVLALLTLGSSRSSLNTARHSMEQTENYYTGCANATETVSEIRDDLEQYREKASDETRYFSMIQKLADTRNDLSWDSHSHTLSFSVGISETQQLSVVLEIFYPQEKSSSAYQILQWNTELTGSWQPDNHQNVFKGE